ncbi:hypothetical protein EYF80_015810 [Liparis tanakae]|uniref:Uncharacterized protein n=1 Tax=Liparis tanakae TaxID=230148 RepID=A0A4Z2I7G8_9TELE|nr:hypothetical protein EYF80_015810 [Liparis tanakae]
MMQSELNGSTQLKGQRFTGEPCPEPEAIPPTQVSEEKENVLTPPEAEQTTETVSVAGSKGVLTRMMRLAQRYLLDPMGRKRAEGARPSQTQAKPRQRSPAPGRVFRNRSSSSLTQAQTPGGGGWGSGARPDIPLPDDGSSASCEMDILGSFTLTRRLCIKRWTYHSNVDLSVAI